MARVIDEKDLVRALKENGLLNEDIIEKPKEGYSSAWGVPIVEMIQPSNACQNCANRGGICYCVLGNPIIW